MDKKLVLAVAGAGKTTYIIDSLCKGSLRVLIVTYTDANYENILLKLRQKNNGVIPKNITVYTYFSFLYNFCFKPFLSDEVKAKGICYESNFNRRIDSSKVAYYMNSSRYLYSNRLSLLLEKANVITDIRARIEKYFDAFVVDEVQDISGRDFNFLLSLLGVSVELLLVGDFYQHTYSTSADGNVNCSLFDDYKSYVKRFEAKGITIDNTLLVNSWRCGEQVCEFVRKSLGIEIYSNNGVTGKIEFIDDVDAIKSIWNNTDIIKLHYQKAAEFGACHMNWGETKGEDCYQDVCVLLNKTTMAAFQKEKLNEMASLTKNKLYVAVTRARGNVYFIDEDKAKNVCVF